MEIKFYNVGYTSNDKFHFAIICAAYKGKWIFVIHKDHDTWEIPAGYREEDEESMNLAVKAGFKQGTLD